MRLKDGREGESENHAISKLWCHCNVLLGMGDITLNGYAERYLTGRNAPLQRLPST